MLMGRPRQQHRHMPPGVRQVAGKWYWRPTNEPTRAVRDRLWPGRKSVTAGDSTDAEGARQGGCKQSFRRSLHRPTS
jgi:hypothetical protein